MCPARRPVRRSPAAIDLRAPPVAVWPGEVVVVASPEAAELRALLAAARRVGPRAIGVGEPPSAYPALDEVRALAESAARGGAVLAGVRLAPGPGARRALAALRARIARRAPCRCVWLVAGRVYPE